MTNELDNIDMVELYPSELAEVKILWAELQRKWGTKTASQQNMRMFKEEVEGRFLNELKLNVTVDTANIEPYGYGEDFVVVPIIEIISRVEPHVLDHSRIAREVQLGYADLNPGTIRADGRWTEPDKIL